MRRQRTLFQLDTATVSQARGRASVEVTPPQVDQLIDWEGQLDRRPGLRRDWYKKARDIRRDPTVKLAREFAVAPLIGGEWSYPEEDGAPAGASQLVEEEMERVRLELLRTSMLGCCDYGWQPFERLASDRPDGFWGFDWLKPLRHDVTTILVDPLTGRYAGLRQDPAAGSIGPYSGTQPIYLGEDETVLVNQDVEGTDWYGEPTLKSLESVWDEQQGISRSARKYDAKIAGSHWVVYYPLGTSTWKGQEDVDNGVIARELLSGIEAVGGLAVPRSVIQSVDSLNSLASNTDALQWKVELLSDKGAGQTPFIDRLKYMDVLKVRAFGFPERSVQEGQFGTKAEAEAHADLAILCMDMRHKLFCAQFTAQCVDWLLLVNYGPSARGLVKIKPAPLADKSRQFLRDIYLLLLQNPQGFMEELQAMDVKGIRDQVGVPSAAVPETYETDLAAVDAAAAELLPPGYEEPSAGAEPSPSWGDAA